MAKDFTEDLENWMKLLPYEIRTIPIINLAVPGKYFKSRSPHLMNNKI